VIAALLAEGNGDRALLPILRWLLASVSTDDVSLEWIDSGAFPARGRTLAEKVEQARLVCPCDLLFVHRDADGEPPERRHEEIARSVPSYRYVAVVPIRMTEAWLLLDEAAIRTAAGRPSGTDPLSLPRLRQLENVADPKATLRGALRAAHGSTGRRARRFDEARAVHRLAALVDDWRPLRKLSAFRRCESDTRSALKDLGCALRPLVS
jgi:hypothetical protein